MKTIIFWLPLFLGVSAIAQVFGTGFEVPEIFNDPYTDTGDATVAHDLLNNTNEPFVDFAPSGSEIGFNARYEPYDTPGVGLTDGDTVGVTDSPPNNSNPFPDGLNGYEISDVDGNFILEFDPVQISSPTISIAYFVSETGYEGDGTANVSASDRLRIYVKDINSAVEYDLLDTTGNDINDLGIEGVWQTASVTIDNSPDITVQLIIEARNNSGAEAFFFDSVHFEGLLGIADISENAVVLYPNPATDFVHISASEISQASVCIYNSLGEKVLERIISHSLLNISALTSGVYFVKLTQENKTTVKKLIVK
ncbi:putative secreted protein (Por secretion system target) [Ulvibacter sp. MAR_2010_11]|uniref:T9SS type A sorting domain-containing protein n=1 Tax=Ulvibacter sp. MAR_2010_11 TaxID=1250229 RepID=UPI000C2C77F8|nr:T9SS type A sorting domain-containing protein [Ulvibacter sp. MAR_2010_11]PKA82658.1 putative secreted protein (Por secretion system target) [Ulvibacter sp. MAR_2010_11]